jgi:hypothetical protein
MRRGALLIGLTCTVLACRTGDLVSGVSDSTFVRAMVSLRRLPSATVLDSASRGRMRDSILTALGIRAAQLESAATRLADDPVRAAALWHAIENAPPPGTKD